MGKAVSLLEKISGPGAVPLSTLIQRGEIAAGRVHADFDDFLTQRIRVLAQMRRALDGGEGEAWRQFYAAVMDLRGSAATAGRKTVNAVCASLETVLTERVRDVRGLQAISSHVDALVLLSSGNTQGAEAEVLIAELEQAVSCLPVRPDGA
ncbi:MAG TPA: hypothetical protein VFI23_08060 [Rhizomicrobium sp.]|nr:hypothetical protein [Rhizomicrobium sp.]